MLRALKLATEEDCQCLANFDDALFRARNTTNCCYSSPGLTQTRSQVRDTTASRKRQVRMRKVKSTILRRFPSRSPSNYFAVQTPHYLETVGSLLNDIGIHP